MTIDASIPTDPEYIRSIRQLVREGKIVRVMGGKWKHPEYAEPGEVIPPPAWATADQQPAAGGHSDRVSSGNGSRAAGAPDSRPMPEVK